MANESDSNIEKTERLPIVPVEIVNATAEAGNTKADDEAQAVRSLDSTDMRDLPSNGPLWPDKRREPSQTNRRFWKHAPLFALVGAVAVVSFVAGGMFARLSSQTPVLVSGQEGPTETTASYTPVKPKYQDDVEETPEEEKEEAPSPTVTPPSYDTGDDTTDDAPTSTSTPDNSTTHQFYFDSEGDEKLEYDEDTGLVTIDYNGYSLTVPIGELMGENDSVDLWSTPSNPQGYGPRSQDRSRTYDYDYDYGTGYDTEEERDRYGWGSPDSSQNRWWNS